jgi:hypothetical protein
VPFPAGTPVPDQLKERPARGAPARAVLGEHAAAGLEGEGVGEDLAAAFLSKSPEDPTEQLFVRLLEDLR